MGGIWRQSDQWCNASSFVFHSIMIMLLLLQLLLLLLLMMMMMMMIMITFSKRTILPLLRCFDSDRQYALVWKAQYRIYEYMKKYLSLLPMGVWQARCYILHLLTMMFTMGRVRIHYLLCPYVNQSDKKCQYSKCIEKKWKQLIMHDILNSSRQYTTLITQHRFWIYHISIFVYYVTQI